MSLVVRSAFLVAAFSLVLAAPSVAQEKEEKKPETAKVGQAAPAFTLKNLDGKEISLADYKGKIVVLEWFNPDCPIVVNHYTAPSAQVDSLVEKALERLLVD